MSSAVPPSGRPTSANHSTFWLLRLIGIETDPKQRFHISLTPRFFGVIVGLVIWGIIGLIGLTEYSTTPGFCKSCHIMEPYYQAWATSKHKNIGCVNCHFSPKVSFLWVKLQGLSQVVKYVTRTYASRPVAEVDDASCLRSGCHSERLLNGKVLTVKGVVFNHTPHLTTQRKGIKLRCASCHSQIMVGTHMEVTYDTCFICHRKDIDAENGSKGCIRCHMVPLEIVSRGTVTIDHAELFIMGEENCMDCHRSVAAGQGEVTKYACVKCHNKPENLKQIEDKDFLHEHMVTNHNVACYNCHTPILHASNVNSENAGRNECASCHPSRHFPEDDFYHGKAVAGVPDMPGSMLLAGVQCAGCHPNAPGGKPTSTAFGIGCQQCHDSSFVQMTQNGQDEVTKTAALLNTAANQTDEIKLALSTSTSAHSAHNLFYAAALLRRAYELENAAGAAPPGASDLPIISGQYCSTLCHPLAGRKIPPETLKFDGLNYPHEMHTQMKACNECHQFAGHKQPGFRGKTVCMDCHDEAFFKAKKEGK